MSPMTNGGEAFHGYIHSIDDALLLVEAVRRRLVPRIYYRLTDAEQLRIRSGSVFVWNEDEANIKRWTELSGSKKLIYGSRHRCDKRSFPERSTNCGVSPKSIQEKYPNAPLNCYSQKDFFRKKTISVRTQNNEKFHLVNYYYDADVKLGRLTRPSQCSEFKKLHVKPGFYLTGLDSTPLMITNPSDVVPMNSSPSTTLAITTSANPNSKSDTNLNSDSSFSLNPITSKKPSFSCSSFPTHSSHSSPPSPPPTTLSSFHLHGPSSNFVTYNKEVKENMIPYPLYEEVHSKNAFQKPLPPPLFIPPSSFSSIAPSLLPSLMTSYSNSNLNPSIMMASSSSSSSSTPLSPSYRSVTLPPSPFTASTPEHSISESEIAPTSASFSYSNPPTSLPDAGFFSYHPSAATSSFPPPIVAPQPSFRALCSPPPSSKASSPLELSISSNAYPLFKALPSYTHTHNLFSPSSLMPSPTELPSPYSSHLNSPLTPCLSTLSLSSTSSSLSLSSSSSSLSSSASSFINKEVMYNTSIPTSSTTFPSISSIPHPSTLSASTLPSITPSSIPTASSISTNAMRSYHPEDQRQLALLNRFAKI